MFSSRVLAEYWQYPGFYPPKCKEKQEAEVRTSKSPTEFEAVLSYITHCRRKLTEKRIGHGERERNRERGRQTQRDRDVHVLVL